MKKRFLIPIIIATVLTCFLTGCKKEELPVCSQCSEEKECKTYQVDGTSYLVCDDCYEEFIASMKEKDAEEKHVCIECKQEKECKTYMIDSVEYNVCDDCYESFAAKKGLINNDITICSLCELEKDCTTYTIDNIDYIVCDDCYNEFAYAFGLDDAPKDVPLEKSEPIPVCSLCEMEKDCDTYVVDGLEYIVCADCYNEFATAFDLLEDTEDVPEETPSETPREDSAEISPTQVCGGCEREKSCKTYTIDDIDYIVCDDCYDEFAHGMGIIE